MGKIQITEFEKSNPAFIIFLLWVLFFMFLYMGIISFYKDSITVVGLRGFRVGEVKGVLAHLVGGIAFFASGFFMNKIMTKKEENSFITRIIYFSVFILCVGLLLGK